MDSQQLQKSRLFELANSLQHRGVSLIVNYSPTLHDREIWQVSLLLALNIEQLCLIFYLLVLIMIIILSFSALMSLVG